MDNPKTRKDGYGRVGSDMGRGAGADGRGGVRGDEVVKDELLATCYDVLGNDRHRAVAELRKLDLENIEQWFDMQLFNIMRAIGAEPSSNLGCDDLLLLRDRLIYLLGGNGPKLSDLWGVLGDECKKEAPENDAPTRDDEERPAETHGDGKTSVISEARSITDELREWLREHEPHDGAVWSLGGVTMYELLDIADRIDRAHEDECQRIHDDMEDECDKLAKQLEAEHALVIALQDASDRNATITAELRKFIQDPLLGYADQDQHARILTAIADRIDEQFARICEQQDRVLKDTIGELVDENDELQAKLDGYDQANVELPRDCDGEPIEPGHMLYTAPACIAPRTVNEITVSLSRVSDGRLAWSLRFDPPERDGYAFVPGERCPFAHHVPDTAEDIAHDLATGAIDEPEAMRRIGALYGG